MPKTSWLKLTLPMNTITNFPATVTDKKVTEKIYGKYVASIYGEDVRQRATSVLHNIV
jgi:hypothetical protein